MQKIKTGRYWRYEYWLYKLANWNYYFVIKDPVTWASWVGYAESEKVAAAEAAKQLKENLARMNNNQTQSQQTQQTQENNPSTLYQQYINDLRKTKYYFIFYFQYWYYFL